MPVEAIAVISIPVCYMVAELKGMLACMEDNAMPALPRGADPAEEARSCQEPGAAAAPARRPSFLRRGQGRGATGAQLVSSPTDAACAGILPFLRGTGTDHRGRWLEEILEWDFERMERVHDYIQWLFPTDESSRFNARAPLLTHELQLAVQQEPSLQVPVGRALRKFCAFLGLEVLGEQGSLTVQKSADFELRSPNCWETRGRGRNHNWLRISRVLHCLRLMGMDEEATALMACLESLHVEGIPLHSAMGHWRERVATVPNWRKEQASAPTAAAEACDCSPTTGSELDQSP